MQVLFSKLASASAELRSAFEQALKQTTETLDVNTVDAIPGNYFRSISQIFGRIEYVASQADVISKFEQSEFFALAVRRLEGLTSNVTGLTQALRA